MPENNKYSQLLFSEFPPVSKSEWEKIANRDLKSDNYKQELTWHTQHGFSILPYYTREDLDHSSAFPLFSSAEWRICERICDGRPAAANRSLLKAINSGADACLIEIDSVKEDSSSGVQIRSEEDAIRLFRNLENQHIELVCYGIQGVENVRENILKSVPDGIIVSFWVEPFRYGRKIKNAAELLNQNLAFSQTRFVADGSSYHNQGASIPEELGAALALASEYLAQSPERKRTEMAASILIKLAAGPLYFPEMAKFRAMRILWKNLLRAYDLNGHIPVAILAETTRINKTDRETPYTNLLRTVTEAMAAITGGADLVLVTPFDETMGEPNDFSKRMARNIQHILREEARFDKAADPAAGSYYIEQLTQTIAKESWKEFQKIEKKGGFLNAMESGYWEEKR